MGQIDLARLIKDSQGWLLELGEVKSSAVGIEQMERFQKRRLLATQLFLAGLLGYRTKLTRLVGIVLVLQNIQTFINLSV